MGRKKKVKSKLKPKFGDKWKKDADFLSKLTPEELAWYRQFEREFYGDDAKTYKDTIHKEDEHWDEIYADKDRSNRDVMNIYGYNIKKD